MAASSRPGPAGSAPKHVAQFIAEDYLRWDSLGEFCALQACLDHIGRTTEGTRAAVLAKTLDTAIGAYLENDRSPARRLGQIDNRGSQFYLALYWAQALATQLDDARLAGRSGRTAESLDNHTDSILAELLAVQGRPVDLGGYYRMDDDRARAAMRPSETFNAVVDGVLNRTLSGDQAD